jgi:hypothetical protein
MTFSTAPTAAVFDLRHPNAGWYWEFKVVTNLKIEVSCVGGSTPDELMSVPNARIKYLELIDNSWV